MNYFSARQRQSDSRWDYTCRNDDRIYPVGYCSGWREYTAEERRQFGMSDTWWAEHEKLKPHYHEDGHATADEACECYKQYHLDTSLRFHEHSSTQQKCVVCQEWTTKRASVNGWESYVLCDAHANREEVEKLYSVGSSCES